MNSKYSVLLFIAYNCIAITGASGAEAVPANMPKKTIDSWCDSGVGEVLSGWLVPHLPAFPQFGTKFGDGKNSKAIPAFQIHKWKAGKASNPIPPEVDFGIEIVSERIEDEIIKNISLYDNVISLHISTKFIQPSSIAHLKNIKKLKYLSIHGAGFNDSHLKEIALINSIQELGIHCQTISDEGVSHLAKLENLCTINLAYLDITGLCFANFSENKKLTYLGSFHSQNEGITDEGAAKIAAIKSLKAIDLSGTKITDKAMILLSKCQSLHSLDVHRTSITNVGVKSISKLSNLSKIIISNTKIDDESSADISRMLNIVDLQIADTKISSSSIKAMAVLHKVERLDVSSNDLDDDACRVFGALKALKYLNIANTKIGDDGVKNLADCKSIQILEVHSNNITDKSIDTLLKFTDLRELNVDSTRITKTGISRLMKSRPNLQIVN